ncbi:hypothetical protein [Bartonella refiksaydamii]|nr:hypothetical protein [Bartonella refiksaydamii]
MLRAQIDMVLKTALKMQDSARFSTLFLMYAAVKDHGTLCFDEEKLEV